MAQARSKAAGALLDNGTGALPDTLADGLKTLLGVHTWPVVRDLVDHVITVDEPQIARATLLVWERMKLCIEPSAGVGVAVALSAELADKRAKPSAASFSPPTSERNNTHPRRLPADRFRNVGVILCGGNLDLSTAAKTLFAEKSH